MSYTPPLGGAVDFVEIGGHTPPLGGAVDFVEGAGAGPVGVVLSAPLSVAVVPRPSVVVSAPLRVQVAVARTLRGSLPVVVLGPSVLGGLDGTTASPGGWSAAPSGAWCAVVRIDDVDYSQRLTGRLVVRAEEDAARVAELEIHPGAPMQPLQLIGKSVAIYFAELRSSAPFAPQLIFTGFVDRAGVDVASGVFSLYCTDRAQYLFDRMGRSKILRAMGGKYHPHVNGDPESGYEFLREVMRAERAAWALNSARAPVRIDWSDASAPVIVRDADVIDGSISISLPNGEGVLSDAEILVELRFPVLRERTARARWAIDMSTLMNAGQDGASVRWPLESMIVGAFEGVADWQLVGKITVTHPPSGVVWSSPTSGVFFIGDEAAAALALGCDAKYRRRWVCDSTHSHKVKVVVLQNRALNPTAQETLLRGASLVSELPDPEWASDLSIGPIPSGGLPAERWQRWYSAGATEDDFDTVLSICRGQAAKELFGSARTARVAFSLPCRPSVWLGAQIRLDVARVLAQGQVCAVEHEMDFGAGFALTHLELAVMPPVDVGAAPDARGGGTDAAQPPDAALSAFSFEVGGPYIGGKQHSPPWSEDNIGFSTNSQLIYPGAEMYPYAFSMRAPELSALDVAPIAGKSVSQTEFLEYTPGILEIR